MGWGCPVVSLMPLMLRVLWVEGWGICGAGLFGCGPRILDGVVV